jgi:hypothetical protein
LTVQSVTRHNHLLSDSTAKTGPSSTMDLIVRHNFYEKTDIRHTICCNMFINSKTFSQTCLCTFFWHIVHVHVQYTFSCRKHCQCHSWYDGEFARESTVHHLVDQNQIHCNGAVQFTPSKGKRSSCQQSKSMLVLAVIRKVTCEKVHYHLEDCGHQKRMVNA